MVNINSTKRLIQEMNSMSHRSQMDMLAMDARILRFYARDGGVLLGIPKYYEIKARFKKQHFLLFGNRLMGFSRDYWNTDMDGRR